MNKTLVMTSLWIASGALATGGTTAVLAVANGNSDNVVLGSADVRAKLEASGPPATATATTRPPGKDRPVVTEAGTIIVRCNRSAVTTYRVIPKPGWTMTDARIAAIGSEPTQAGTPSPARLTGLLVDFHHATKGDFRAHVLCHGQEVATKVRSLTDGPR